MRRTRYILLLPFLVWAHISLAQAPSSSWAVGAGIRPEINASGWEESGDPSYWLGLTYMSYAGRRHAWGGSLGYSKLQRYRESYIVRSINYQSLELSGIYRYWPLNEPGSRRFVQPYFEGSAAVGVTGIYSGSNQITGRNNYAFGGMLAIGTDFRGQVNQLGVKAGAGWQQIGSGPFPTLSSFDVDQHLHSVPYLHLSVYLSWPKRRKSFSGSQLASYAFPKPETYLPPFTQQDTISTVEPATANPVKSEPTMDSLNMEPLTPDTILTSLNEPPVDEVPESIATDSALIETQIPADSSLTAPIQTELVQDSISVLEPDPLPLVSDSLGVPPEESSIDSLKVPAENANELAPTLSPDSTATEPIDVPPLKEDEVEEDPTQGLQGGQDPQEEQEPAETGSNGQANTSSGSTDRPTETNTIVSPTPIIVPVEKLVRDTVIIRDTLVIRDTLWLVPSAGIDSPRDSKPPGSLENGTEKLIVDMDSLEMELLAQENKLLREEVEWLRANQKTSTNTAISATEVKTADTVYVELDRTAEIRALTKRLKELQDSLAAVPKPLEAASIPEAQQIIYFSNGTVAPPVSGLNELLELVNAHRDDLESINIRVYTDSRGSEITNLAFASKRGEYLKNALLKSGVPVTKISVFPYGEQQAKTPADPKDRKAVIDIRYRGN